MSRKENGRYVPRIVWDVVPSYWGAHMDCMDPVRWRDCDICRHSDTVEIYDRVTEEFDRLLAGYGYVRDGNIYRVEKEDQRTKNDGAWMHFPSASLFSSTANASLSDFYRILGCESSTNAYSITGSTPLAVLKSLQRL